MRNTIYRVEKRLMQLEERRRERETLFDCEWIEELSPEAQKAQLLQDAKRLKRGLESSIKSGLVAEDEPFRYECEALIRYIYKITGRKEEE